MSNDIRSQLLPDGLTPLFGVSRLDVLLMFVEAPLVFGPCAQGPESLDDLLRLVLIAVHQRVVDLVTPVHEVVRVRPDKVCVLLPGLGFKLFQPLVSSLVGDGFRILRPV